MTGQDRAGEGWAVATSPCIPGAQETCDCECHAEGGPVSQCCTNPERFWPEHIDGSQCEHRRRVRATNPKGDRWWVCLDCGARIDGSQEGQR